MPVAQLSEGARRTTHARDRVTIDLRGLGPQLQAQAARRQMTVAALMRQAFTAMLDEAPQPMPDDGRLDHFNRAPAIKVTLRLPARHAKALAHRAHAADVSQGSYVASLLDGAPAEPMTPDRTRAVAALLASTDRLAALSTDLNAILRLLRHAQASQIEPYRASLRSLVQDVRVHLAASAALVASLRSSKGRP